MRKLRFKKYIIYASSFLFLSSILVATSCGANNNSNNNQQNPSNEIQTKVESIFMDLENKVNNQINSLSTKLPSECVDDIKLYLNQSFVENNIDLSGLTITPDNKNGKILVVYKISNNSTLVEKTLLGFKKQENINDEFRNTIDPIFTDLQNRITSNATTIKYPQDNLNEIKLYLETQFKNSNFDVIKLELTPNNQLGIISVYYEIKFSNNVFIETKELNNFLKVTNPVAPTPTQPYNYTPHLTQELPIINIVTNSGNNDFATEKRDYFTEDHEFIKQEFAYNTMKLSIGNCNESYKKLDIPGQIKIRGNSTPQYDKKPFRIKFDTKQSMLGLNNQAPAKNWVLLADYKDASLLRNNIGFYLSKILYGSQGLYASDFQNVDLYLNGEYWGVYLLCEQNEVSSKRVNITETPKYYTGTNIGYLVEYDCYAHFEKPLEQFQIDYDNWAELKPVDSNKDIVSGINDLYAIKNDVYSQEQQNFISKYIANVYRILYRAIVKNEAWKFNDDKSDIIKDDSINTETAITNVLDVESAVSTYILQEIVCDADLAQSSFYMTADFGPNQDGKLRFQVPWDFDTSLGFYNMWETGSQYYGIDRVFAGNYNGNPWTVLFYKSDFIRNKIKEKWNNLITRENIQKIFSYVDSCVTNYEQSYKKNFDKWKNIGENLKIEAEKDNPNKGFSEMYWAFPDLANVCTSQADYAGYLKYWLQTRIENVHKILTTSQN
ncbi:CotH kinase family protein [Mycoplasmoides pirum]|uniref:CotH kinase family protein n=1 Tax=Mycoplasmoides pirum TaxID=2122 RepID=UPI0004834405|nr:CotH kinase family protein [Mycoplasmoides pirum]